MILRHLLQAILLHSLAGKKIVSIKDWTKEQVYHAYIPYSNQVILFTPIQCTEYEVALGPGVEQYF